MRHDPVRLATCSRDAVTPPPTDPADAPSFCVAPRELVSDVV